LSLIAPGEDPPAARVAVTGVSRTPNGHGGNIEYQRLRDRGYEVYAVNPNADGGCPCMLGPTADMGHRIMRPLLTAAGKVPRRV
jgi:hypothetical protein